jgi:hypothetical protein
MAGRSHLRATFAGVQFFVSNFIGPQLTDILSSLSAITGLVVLLRFWHPRLTADRTSSPAARYSAREVALAWMPYMLLVVFVLAWGYKPIQQLLNTTSVSFPWPWLHNEIQRMPPVIPKATAYGAIYNLNWLSAAGTSCMFAVLLSALFLGMKPKILARLLVDVARQLFLPTVTVSAVLAMAFVMNYCGATGTLGGRRCYRPICIRAGPIVPLYVEAQHIPRKRRRIGSTFFMPTCFTCTSGLRFRYRRFFRRLFYRRLLTERPDHNRLRTHHLGEPLNHLIMLRD